MVGWRIKATYPTGPDDQLRWQDGFVLECRQKHPDTGPTYFEYRIFIEVDAGDE